MEEKVNLELLDFSEYPKEMRTYLKNYGFHFSKKACKEAIRGLRYKNPATGKFEPLTDIKDKEEVESMLAKNNVKIENDVLYDVVWVYHMLMSDYWKSAIDDETHLAKAVKAVLDDPDQRNGFIFNRWIGDRYFNGDPISWEDLL